MPGKKKAKYSPLLLASKVISKRNLESSDSDEIFDPKECVKVKTTRQVKKRASKYLSKIIIESSDSDNSSDQNEYVKLKTTRNVKNLCNNKVLLNDNKIVTKKKGKYVNNDNDSDEVNTDIIDIIHKSVNAYGIPHTHTIRGKKFLLKPVSEKLLINLFTENMKKGYQTSESIEYKMFQGGLMGHFKNKK